MRRLSLWMRMHPMFGDSVIAAVLALLDLSAVGSPFADAHPVAFWTVGALLLLPLVARRRNPLLTAYVIGAGGALQLFTHGTMADVGSLSVRVGDLALGVALYTLVVYVGRRRAMGYAGLLVIGTGGSVAWQLPHVRTAILLGAGAVVIFGFCWVLGEFVGARRAYHTEVERRLALLETERDQHARIAVAQERTRIARELHDVVAHAVSVIVVQADGAGYAIDSDPELARTAVRTISDTGREALSELRRLLDVLRGDSDDGDERAPQPGVSDLAELVERVTAVGLPVWLVFRGDLAGLPAGVGLGVYRIVQEALTNALRHAGHGASAAVRVERVGGMVELEVTDDGTGRPGGPVTVSGGNGLIGMRERASVLGGTLVAGHRPGGGWGVRATFPVRADSSLTA